MNIPGAAQGIVAASALSHKKKLRASPALKFWPFPLDIVLPNFVAAIVGLDILTRLTITLWLLSRTR